MVGNAVVTGTVNCGSLSSTNGTISCSQVNCNQITCGQVTSSGKIFSALNYYMSPSIQTPNVSPIFLYDIVVHVTGVGKAAFKFINITGGELMFYVTNPSLTFTVGADQKSVLLSISYYGDTEVNVFVTRNYST